MEVLRALTTVLPVPTVIGSFARDYWALCVADVNRVAVTLDVDVTILVDTLQEYRRVLTALGAGPRDSVVKVLGFEVDVIPYGGLETDGIVETTPGVTLDVTGMREAVAGAERVVVDDLVVCVPQLADMIGLKVIAWGYRQELTDKDARDIGVLFDVTHRGPFGDELWQDEAAGVRCDYDPVLMGPFRAGRSLGRSWDPTSRLRLTETLSRNAADLAARISRFDGSVAGLRMEQIDALRSGVQVP